VLSPSQISVDPFIVKELSGKSLILTIISLLETVFGATQSIDEVTKSFIMSLSESELVEKIVVSFPVLIPLICH